jgi:hypothetical protein
MFLTRSSYQIPPHHRVLFCDRRCSPMCARRARNRHRSTPCSIRHWPSMVGPPSTAHIQMRPQLPPRPRSVRAPLPRSAKPTPRRRRTLMRMHPMNCWQRSRPWIARNSSARSFATSRRRWHWRHRRCGRCSRVCRRPRCAPRTCCRYLDGDTQSNHGDMLYRDVVLSVIYFIVCTRIGLHMFA